MPDLTDERLAELTTEYVSRFFDRLADCDPQVLRVFRLVLEERDRLLAENADLRDQLAASGMTAAFTPGYVKGAVAQERERCKRVAAGAIRCDCKTFCECYGVVTLRGIVAGIESGADPADQPATLPLEPPTGPAGPRS